jgi:hypothetical protein
VLGPTLGDAQLCERVDGVLVDVAVDVLEPPGLALHRLAGDVLVAADLERGHLPPRDRGGGGVAPLLTALHDPGVGQRLDGLAVGVAVEVVESGLVGCGQGRAGGLDGVDHDGRELVASQLVGRSEAVDLPPPGDVVQDEAVDRLGVRARAREVGEGVPWRVDAGPLRGRRGSGGRHGR